MVEAGRKTRVILVGNPGRDRKYAICRVALSPAALATSESWRDKQTGEMKERTEWHRVVMFGKLAEVAGEYLRKVLRCISGSIAYPQVDRPEWRGTLYG